MNYFIAPDSYGELTLWRGEPDDPRPMAVLSQWQIGHDDDEVWDLIARTYPTRDVSA